MNLARRDLLAGGLGLAGLWGCSGDAPLSLVGPVEAPQPWASPDSSTIDFVSHVLARTSFGVSPGDRDALLSRSQDTEEACVRWIDAQLDPDSIEDGACERAVRRLETLAQPVGELYEFRPALLLRELTTATWLRAVHSKRQLFEVLCQFWTDHFNIDVSKGECAWLKTADDRDVIRRHALGRFEDLLSASAKSPAMLWYLDGRVNRAGGERDRPNENYARELLELHSLGIDGGYTQRDVMEVARCLSGWTLRDRSGFFKARLEFHREHHDDGEKLVLGQRIPAGGGAEDFDAVLRHVARHPSTARHIAAKLARRFIADDARGNPAAEQAFASSGGDLRATLRALFASAEFRAPACRGTKLKRPFHFAAACLRSTGAPVQPPLAWLGFLERMGHAPFQHPTPDGYPEDSHAWTGTLLWRWRAAEAAVQSREGSADFDAAALEARFGGAPRLLAHLFGRAPNEAERAEIAELSDAADRLVMALASPAFQRT